MYTARTQRRRLMLLRRCALYSYPHARVLWCSDGLLFLQVHVLRIMSLGYDFWPFRSFSCQLQLPSVNRSPFFLLLLIVLVVYCLRLHKAFIQEQKLKAAETERKFG